MTRIMLCEPDNAPGCIAEILNTADERELILVQTDWDWPGVASSFGWNIANVPWSKNRDGKKCSHRATDGTINCPGCGCPVEKFLEEAAAFIESNYGKTIEDPGYFDRD